MDKKKSEIQSYYKNKTIFFTSASGFMGKVLLEKLLYSCSEIDKIYIIIRSKKGHNIDTRLSNIFDLPLFQRIKIEKPNVLQKVIPLNGDITSDNLGLTEEQRERLINEVHVVFHCAASTRFDTKLKDAIELNTVRY
nr:PREDICTED: putative fatty acyl-CoA reductase CG5065 [Linepithema humile]